MFRIRCGNCRTNQGKQPHVAGQTDKVNFVLLKGGDDFAVVLFPRTTLRRNHERNQSALAGNRDPRRIGPVRDNDGNLCIGDAAGINAICNRNEVRATSGKKYAQRTHAALSHQPSAVSESIIIHQELRVRLFAAWLGA